MNKFDILYRVFGWLERENLRKSIKMGKKKKEKTVP